MLFVIFRTKWPAPSCDQLGPVGRVAVAMEVRLISHIDRAARCRRSQQPAFPGNLTPRLNLGMPTPATAAWMRQLSCDREALTSASSSITTMSSSSSSSRLLPVASSLSPPTPPPSTLQNGTDAQSTSGTTSMLRVANEEQPHVGKYRLIRTIGKGNFAKVKLARHVITGREVSIYVKQLSFFSILPSLLFSFARFLVFFHSASIKTSTLTQLDRLKFPTDASSVTKSLNFLSLRSGL